MQKLIKLEEAAMLLMGIWWFSELPFAWWWFPVSILLPDLSMLGYLAGNKVGARLYNLFHHKAGALIVILAGIYLKEEPLHWPASSYGLIPVWIAYSATDLNTCRDLPIRIWGK